MTTAALTQTFKTREEWLKARGDAVGIGSSDAPVIMGLSKYKSPLALYYEKIGEAPTEEPSEPSERLEWGLVLEEPIAQRFERETKRSIIRPPEFSIQIHPSLPWMRCAVDRFQVIDKDSKPAPLPVPMGVAEIKNVDFFLGQEWEDEPPVAFQIQLQHQLAVTGLTWGSIVGLVGGNRFRWQDQTRNEEFIALLLEAEHEFVERVQKRLPPPADGSASTKALLKKLYPKDNGEAIALPVELIEADIQLRALKDAQKEAGKEIDRLENLFKQAIGEATAGALSNGVSYTHKWQQRAGYTCQATEFRVLRRQAAKGEKIKLSPEDFNGAAR